ncbi:MAG TPA: hypothetical protein VLS89_19365, partial [Candidatus Nanopelagicales bacterium]|nr:hypothetical protein [Candidatus Nanopelagicales bacterium]
MTALRRCALITTGTLLLALCAACDGDDGTPPSQTTTTTTSSTTGTTTTTTTETLTEEETYTVGGTVVGLEGAGLVLQNNGGDDLSIDADGSFGFLMTLAPGQAYSVTVSAQPTGPSQHCWVEGGDGIVGESDVNDVLVRCSVDPSTIDLTDADRCDPLDPAYCLFPFPNDHFTVEDPDTDTLRRVALRQESMPLTASVDLSPYIGASPGTLVTPGGVHMDPAEWNRSDGFSPGQMVLTLVPGLDLEQSGIGGIDHMNRSMEDDSPLVVIDADTGDRHLVWGELDSYASGDPTRALILRAGTNFREGHRYIVALRDLRGADGALLEPSPAFRVYRDGVPSQIDALEGRRPHMEAMFDRLEEAGVARESLYLAWDFTVASRRSLSERMLHIRDDAFVNLGAAAPAFTVTQVIQNPDANRSRRIIGTFTVPNYLNQAGGVSGS